MDNLAGGFKSGFESSGARTSRPFFLSCKCSVSKNGRATCGHVAVTSVHPENWRTKRKAGSRGAGL